MTPTKLIATYSRVSTARQEEEQTIKTQILVLKEFAEKNGLTIVKEYSDEGWSGDILARPSLDELRTDAKKKVWEAVLIYDPDRLARRYSYQELVMDELKEAGIEIIFITVSAPKNSEDKILHGVRGLFAEYERAKIAERFRLGKLRKVKDGHIQVSTPLYGYRYIPIKDGKPGYYEVNESEADVVRKIFQWVADEGLSLRKVVMRLHQMGILPRKNKRGVWNITTISELLDNTTYFGEATWGRTVSIVPLKPKNQERYRKMKKTSKRKRPPEEWIIIPVPPIISKELFDHVSKRLRDNSTFSGRNKKYEYLLVGKIYCTCGHRRAGQGRKNGTGLFYRCTDRLRSFPLPPTCKLKGVGVKIADSMVWDKLSELMLSPDLLKQQAERFINTKSASVQSPSFYTATFEKEIEKLKAQEHRYNEAYGSGLFTLEKLQHYITPIRQKITSLQSQVSQNQQINDEYDRRFPQMEDIESFASRTANTMKELNFETRRKIVLSVVDKVIANKEEITVKGCIPINENVALCTTDRDSQDTIQPIKDGNTKSIPFNLVIRLPPLRKKRR